MTKPDLQVNFRMPAALKARLEDAAKENHRSLTAELIARLEETFEIEIALKTVAPGASVTGTSGLLMDLHEQLEQRENDALFHSMGTNAEKIEQHMDQTEANIASLNDQVAAILKLLQSGNP